MKLLNKSQKFFAFNSETEFLNIVYLLDQDATASPECLIDEKEGRTDLDYPYDLYY